MHRKTLITSTVLASLCALLVIFLTVPEAMTQAGQYSAANWGEQVGFKPDLSAVNVTPGTRVDGSNVDQYASALPDSMVMWIKKYKLNIKLGKYEPSHPSVGYIQATNKYAGQPTLIPTGNDVRKSGLKGYTAGLPFPQPQSGLEVAWNFQYSYNGDDGDIKYAVYWISANSGIEHFEEWRWSYILRTINRTDLAPIPAIQSFLDQGIQYTSITYASYPYDKKGFGALFSRSVKPLDQQGHIYIPAMRRVLRNTFGTRGDSWNSTDMLYEDVRGFMGYPEWMNWKLVAKKTMLFPMNANVKLGKANHKRAYDFENWPYWNPQGITFTPRPVYVVEVTPKLSDYPYSKMVFYYDAETHLILFKECYDKKGQLWKLLLIGYNESRDMNSLPPEYGTQVVVDLQAEHASIFAIYEMKINLDLDPNEFTLSTLRKKGR
jgi:Protein of unknown function (DUF1329)